MSRIRTLSIFALGVLLFAASGCSNRPGWGFSWGQGTTAQQKARATVHDPFPLNDIGPEVVGGRPREFYNPQPEAVRNQNTRNGY